MIEDGNVVKTEVVDDGSQRGRPKDGTSRATQQAWQRFKSSKKGSSQLAKLSASELVDFRRSWMLNKEESTNTVAQTSKTTMSKKDEKETGWYTQSQLAMLENCSPEAAEALAAGLPHRPSRFSHLQSDPQWTEYWYVHNSKRKEAHESTSAMELRSHVEADHVDMLNHLDADLGVGEFDAGTASSSALTPVQPPSGKKPRLAHPKVGAPPAVGDAGPSSGQPSSADAAGKDDDPVKETSLIKVEGMMASLAKQARELLRGTDKLLTAKPYLKGMV